MTPYLKYCHQVTSGQEPACEYVRLACQRHLNDLETGHERGLYFDESEADRAIAFMQYCRHWKGSLAGQNIELQPFQQFIIASIFGWKNEDGTRRFRTAYTEMARKNAKTTLAALIALYHIVADGVTGAQVYAGATKEDQARIVVNDAGKIAQRTPDLRDMMTYRKMGNEIFRVIFEEGGSYIRPIGRNSDTQDGFDPSLGIIDEYHAHKTDDVFDIIETGMGARTNPLMCVITTAGYHKAYPCYSKTRKTIIRILRGELQDDGTFGIIFTLDEKDDWEDPSNWIKANPLMPAMPSIAEHLKNAYVKAKNEGGSKIVAFKTKNLNIWTDSATVWIADDRWMALANKITPESLTGTDIFTGLDLAMKDDFSAITIIHLLPDDRYHFRWKFYIPEANYQEREKLGIPVQEWVKRGFLTVTPGNVTDYHYIAEDYISLTKQYNHVSGGYDAHLATMLVTELTERGISLNPHTQNMKTFSVPIAWFEKLVNSAQMTHDGNPVQRWMMGNVLIKTHPTQDDLKMLIKDINGEKIDGPVSTIMACGEYLDQDYTRGSIYDTQDLKTL